MALAVSHAATPRPNPSASLPDPVFPDRVFAQRVYAELITVGFTRALRHASTQSVGAELEPRWCRVGAEEVLRVVLVLRRVLVPRWRRLGAALVPLLVFLSRCCRVVLIVCCFGVTLRCVCAALVLRLCCSA